MGGWGVGEVWDVGSRLFSCELDTFDLIIFRIVAKAGQGWARDGCRGGWEGGGAAGGAAGLGVGGRHSFVSFVRYFFIRLSK